MKTAHFKKICCLGLTALLLLFAPLATAEEAADAAQPQYQAYAKVALKVRRAPEQNASGMGSISKGSTVYILEFVNENWARVSYGQGEGYVMTKYLDSIISSDGLPAVPVVTEQPFTAEVDGFREAYQAFALNQTPLRETPDENGRVLAQIPVKKKVIVSVVDGDWCYASYGGHYGYVLCSKLFKWDRLVADAGAIPGLDVMPLLIFTNKSTDILAYESNEVHQTVNPGAAFAAFEKDGAGRYGVPYDRTVGYVNEDDVSAVMQVVNWEEAHPGDLISVASTFYALGVHSLQYQGRNWNIHLASSMISGVILQPGETYDQYQVIGPYRKSTGYHSAPILKEDALTGYGGGTCQVNTTFYVANIQVPILVTHRKVHADVGMDYIKQGFDAAVGGGDINLTLVNTLPYPIRYHFFDSDGVLTCAIFRES